MSTRSIFRADGAQAKYAGPRLAGGVFFLDMPLASDAETGWIPYPLFHGRTRNLRFISCHASSLAPGHCPHPPHSHQEEEFMMVLRGEVDLIFPDDGPLAPDGPRRMRRGDFVYYPVGFSHTLKTVGEIPANYLMVKWSGPRNDSASPLTFQAGSVSSTVFSGMTPGGFSSVVAFEGATEYLKKFHVHISCVAPHGGYGAHRDPHDVVMVILEGEAETVGRRVRPGSVIYYASGEAHGLSNFSSGPVRYVVLEFHGRTVSRLHSAWEQLRRSFR